MRAFIGAVFLLAACSGGDDRERRATGPVGDNVPRSTSGPVSDTGMAGMDHSRMNMSGDTTTAPLTAPLTATPTAPARTGAMAGMDHSQMNMAAPARPSSPAPQGGGMAGMDHTQMAMAGTPATPPAGRPRAAATAPVDHANMPGMQPPARASERSVPRQGMQGMQATAPDAATMKLQRLVAELVQDSLVRERIQADSVLRNRWQDPEVRRILLGQP